MKSLLIFLLSAAVTNCGTYAQDANYQDQFKSGYRGGFIKGLQVPENAIHFIVVGDWGRQGEYNQKEVANQMANASVSLNADFIISTGDNFYPDGVQSIWDSKWKESFEEVYKHFALQKKWYVVLGNHDYRSNPQAQVEYSKISSRWQMPSRYFTKTILINNDTTQQVLIAFIDTSPFIKSYYSNEEYEKNINIQDTATQIKWLDSLLSNKSPNIKWKIVVGHHPLYSGGKRINSKDTKDINALLKPLFDKYNVDVYLNGHEHHLEYVKPLGVTHFFTSGSGSEVRPVKLFPKDGKFAESQPGFMTISIVADKILMHAINQEGRIIYSTTIKKQKDK